MPTTWLSVLLFMVAIAPGLLFDLGSTKRRVRAKESAFHEIARITLGSLVFSGLAVGLAVLAHRWWPETFLNLDQAIRGGWAYVKDHQVPAAASLVLVVSLSLTAAWVVNLVWAVCVLGWKNPGMRSTSAWSVVFKPGVFERGTWVLATATLSDGSVVRGRVADFSADLEQEDRELVLEPPIATRVSGGKAKERPELDAVIVSGGQVTKLLVEYRAPDQPAAKSRWARLIAVAVTYGPTAGAIVVAVAMTLVNAWAGIVAGVLVAALLYIVAARFRKSRSVRRTPEPDAPAASQAAPAVELLWIRDEDPELRWISGHAADTTKPGPT